MTPKAQAASRPRQGDRHGTIGDRPEGYPTRAGDRRRADQGAPNGVERRAARRRASDQPKTVCPWCGASTSAVTFTRWAARSDRYRRRRECSECGEKFPTKETLDREQFELDLAKRGLTLADVGIDRSLPT